MHKLMFKDKLVSLDPPLIMGILNVTPDSFSDGGQHDSVDTVVEYAKQMIADGADIIDIGGESTRPGSDPVSVDEELSRVVPVVKRLLEETDTVLSIDTMKPEVAQTCLELGVHMLNDVTGLRNDEMIQVAAKFNVPVVIMHMLGTPKVMQESIGYEDVVLDVKKYLKEQAQKAQQAGITQLILDPGIGFGKTVEHNLQLIKRLGEFKDLGNPLLIGASRKSFIGKLTGASVDQRLPGTLAAHSAAIINGANIIRVHDVKEGKQASLVAAAIRGRNE